MKKVKTIVGFIALSLQFAGCAAQSSPEGDAPKASAAIETKAANLQSARVSPPESDAAESAVAADKDGDIYVVWVEHGANKQANIFLQKFDSRLNPNGEPVRVNRNEGEATAWRGDPPTIAIGEADDAVYVGWTARVEADSGSANNLCLSVSRDGGKSFDAPFKVNDDAAPAVHGMHSLAIDKSGRVYFAWLDERNLKGAGGEMEMAMPQTGNDAGAMNHERGEANREVYFAASGDGGRSFAANKKIASDVCPCCKTSMIAAPDGKIYLSWRQVLAGDHRHIAVAASGDGGANFGAPSIVSDDEWQISGCPVSGAALALGENDALEVAWFTAGAAGAPGLYRAESIDGARSFSPRVLVGETEILGTPQMKSDGRNDFRLTWAATDGKIYAETAASLAANGGETVEIGDGEMPATTVFGNSLFVAFDKKEGGGRVVQLARVD